MPNENAKVNDPYDNLMAKKCQQTQKGFYGCIEKLLCLYIEAVDVSKLFETVFSH